LPARAAARRAQRRRARGDLLRGPGTEHRMSPDTGEVHLADDGDVWWLELSNPGRHNALTWRMYDRLEEICAATHAAPGLRVLVVRGGGGSFAAGTDIAQFTEF